MVKPCSNKNVCANLVNYRTNFSEINKLKLLRSVGKITHHYLKDICSA